MIIFKEGDVVAVNNNKPLPGNTVAPPLELDEEYVVKGILVDKDGRQHLDVGLVSKYNYITGYESRYILENGHKIHWCHPSRFIKVNENVCSC